jgi:steroid delta-isomerase-like uncharacterized protein
MTERMLITDTNKAVVRRLFDEVLNQHNLALIDQLYAPNYVSHALPPALPANREGTKQFLGDYFRAFPDLQFSIEDMIAEGDRVVVRYTGRGTHQGDLMGIAPTGKQATASAVVIVRIEEGKVAEDWLNLDQLGLLQQLGVIPPPERAGS